ncbi:MAG: glycosyltransferase, partial [Terrimicrobiaceae bacterium]|nr:glycosyltransferase [Terrimicrobiaceae bacterium]
VRWGGPLRLVICGSHNYERRYYARLRRAAGEGVIFTGGRFGDAYIELSQNAAFFAMPAAIEATRLVLLDQMGMGAAILFREAAATREVLGDAGEAYEPEGLVEALGKLAADPERCRHLGKLARARAEALFSWERVTDRYIEIFQKWEPSGA